MAKKKKTKSKSKMGFFFQLPSPYGINEIEEISNDLISIGALDD